MAARDDYPELHLWAIPPNATPIDSIATSREAANALGEIDTLRATVARLETELAALQRDTQPYIVTAVNRCDLETRKS